MINYHRYPQWDELDMRTDPLVYSVAPMEGITIFPTRLWLALASRPEAATTPFLRATQVFPTRELPAAFAPELFQLRGVLPYRLTPQIMACTPDNFLRAAELLPAGEVELNCGCPTQNGAGNRTICAGQRSDDSRAQRQLSTRARALASLPAAPAGGIACARDNAGAVP